MQWADWAADGRLLVATTAGELQVRPDPARDAVDQRVDLAVLRPTMGEPPPEAREW